MSERERMTGGAVPEDGGVAPQGKRWRALCAAADLPLKPSEALRRRVAELAVRHHIEAAQPDRRWLRLSLSRGTTRAVVAATLLAGFGVMLAWWDLDRSRGTSPHATGTRPLTAVPRPPKEQGLRSPGRPESGTPWPNVLIPPEGGPPVVQTRIQARATGASQPRGEGVGNGASPALPPGHPLSPGRPVALREEWDRIERWVRRDIQVRDDFVEISFPRLVDATGQQIAAAVDSYKREAAIVDSRLSREVTLTLKATALSDLCDQLRRETDIRLEAGRSVADEKVTVFCRAMPLREVMRQLSRPFGYTWLRSGKKEEYRYELVQDLRSQLLEEELRNRDRNAALLAVDEQMSRYRPYLGLPPDELRTRIKSSAPGENRPPEHLAGTGWGPLQLYFGLSPHELAALRAGQQIIFSEEPGPGQQPLPPGLTRGVLQSIHDRRIVRRGDRFDAGSMKGLPDGLPPASVPEARAIVSLRMDRSELGQITLQGGSGFSIGTPPDGVVLIGDDGPIAIGVSPAVRQPQNAVANAKRVREPALRRRVTVRPQSSCEGVGRWTLGVGGGEAPGAPTPRPTPTAGGGAPQRPTHEKVTSADVLEALHQASGLNIVADYYTRLYPASAVSVREVPLFEALNQLADAMRLRWSWDRGTREAGGWLQFRSASYYDDRLKEIPNRLLARWVASRRQHGALTLDDLVEIAGLSDAQLDSAVIAEGARECFGLAEWHLARSDVLRPNWRYLAGFTPAQRLEATSDTGLPFTRMSLPQQQQFMTLALGSLPDSLSLGLAELSRATLRVDYSLPGEFQWAAPEPPEAPTWRKLSPPPVRAPSREAALQAARRIDPQASEAQIHPTELTVTLVYTLGGADARLTPLVIRADPRNTIATSPRPVTP